MKRIIILFLCIWCNLISAQRPPGGIKIGPPSGGIGTGSNNNQADPIRLDGPPDSENNPDYMEDDEPEHEKAHYTDYKIITKSYDTIVIDTTQNIRKAYKFNFRRKDNFELLEFHNQGQTLTTLAYDFSQPTMYPDIGFRAKQFAFYNVDDIDYYRVPTPTSEVFVRTGLEQGQLVDALFTTNLSPRLNIAGLYRGLRSLGHYQESLSRSGAFRTSMTYENKNGRYALRMHYVNQDFLNQESGGLSDVAVRDFRLNNPSYNERNRFETVLSRAESTLEGKRMYLDHSYKLISNKDTLDVDLGNVKLGHEFIQEKKSFLFKQESVTTEVFGTAASVRVRDTVSYKLTNNQAYLEMNTKYVLGSLKVKANLTNLYYGIDTILNVNRLVNKIALQSKAYSLGASWKARIGKLKLLTDVNLVPGESHLSGYYFKSRGVLEKDSLFSLTARLSQTSKEPNFNFQQMQSAYDAYNWSNNFRRVTTQNIGGDFLSKWGNLSVDLTNMINYTYFNQSSKPQQYNNLLTYFKFKADKEFTYRKFSLANTILYQDVTSGSNVFRVPRMITRNTLYYTDEWFKGKPLFVNLGVTFKYFSKYKMNAYNPLLAEFRLQNDTEIGYPMFDVFLNARIRRTRLFFKAENVASKWMPKEYFSAPNYPYRDYTIRFGLVWNWFI